MSMEKSIKVRTTVLKKMQSQEPILFAHVADCYMQIGKMSVAGKLLKKGIARFPDYATGWVVLGNLHLMQNKEEKAREAFKKALEIDPDIPYAHERCSELANDEGDKDDYLYHVTALVKLDPMSDSAQKIHHAEILRRIAVKEDLYSQEEAERVMPGTLRQTLLMNNLLPQELTRGPDRDTIGILDYKSGPETSSGVAKTPDVDETDELEEPAIPPERAAFEPPEPQPTLTEERIYEEEIDEGEVDEGEVDEGGIDYEEARKEQEQDDDDSAVAEPQKRVAWAQAISGSSRESLLDVSPEGYDEPVDEEARGDDLELKDLEPEPTEDAVELDAPSHHQELPREYEPESAEMHPYMKDLTKPMPEPEADYDASRKLFDALKEGPKTGDIDFPPEIVSEPEPLTVPETTAPSSAGGLDASAEETGSVEEPVTGIRAEILEFESEDEEIAGDQIIEILGEETTEETGTEPPVVQPQQDIQPSINRESRESAIDRLLQGESVVVKPHVQLEVERGAPTDFEPKRTTRHIDALPELESSSAARQEAGEHRSHIRRKADIETSLDQVISSPADEVTFDADKEAAVEPLKEQDAGGTTAGADAKGEVPELETLDIGDEPPRADVDSEAEDVETARLPDREQETRDRLSQIAREVTRTSMNGERLKDSEPAPKKPKRIATKTLAELYASQGDWQRAIEVYEELLERHPGNESYRKRLDVLKSKIGTEGNDY